MEFSYAFDGKMKFCPLRERIEISSYQCFKIQKVLKSELLWLR